MLLSLKLKQVSSSFLSSVFRQNFPQTLVFIQEGRRREPVLVGHPLTALERELKRLVVREELEKEQLRIIRESGLSSKDVSLAVSRLV